MIGKNSISTYTPSNTDPETRKRIFVQRHKLLDRVVSWCEESMLTGDKHHLLLIGPRGSGKTHLITMVHDRLSEKSKLDEKMRVAWLGEDSVFTGLIDFALEIADELANKHPEEFDFDYRDKARQLKGDDAAELILGEIVRRLGDKSILLIMENLDRAFSGLGDLGQKKWRAFLQENQKVATLATSQQLFEGISSRDAAFYGFFEIMHLEPLSVDDAGELIEKIARENDNRELVNFLATPEGRYRVRALHGLAGGNHRMYVMLSEFLTKDSLDGLVKSFEDLADNLTPYFQERINSLSPQQARIIQSLCGAPGAMTVKGISEDTFIPDGNVSRQLGDLKKKKYVISEKRGKESYYEMAEPLMRLSLEVKKQRGKPLRLVAAFLRAWYSDKALQVELDAQSMGGTFPSKCQAYKEKALRMDDANQNVINGKPEQEFDSKMASKRFKDAMKIAEEIAYVDPMAGMIRKSRVFMEQGKYEGALKEINDVISLHGLTAAQEADALFNRGFTFTQLGETKKAFDDYSTIIELEKASVDHKSRALFYRGIAYEERGETQKANDDFSEVVEMGRIPVEQKVMAIMNRGITYGKLGENQKAIMDYTSVLEMDHALVGEKARALVGRGTEHWRLQQYPASLKDFTDAVAKSDVPSATNTHALFCVPEATIPMGTLNESMASLERAFSEGDPNTEFYGGSPADMFLMILNREHYSWAEYIERIVLIYAKYEALSILGAGLTQSIEFLDSDGYSEVQLELWNSSWKKAGSKHDKLSISLSALDAAVRVIIAGNDRPLFDLPLEIRELVLPLLKNTLQKKGEAGVRPRQLTNRSK